MTDEERTALRAEIEELTIRQARQRGEVATETLRILGELGLGGVVSGVAKATGTNGHNPAPTPPAACPVCGRATASGGGAAECDLGLECLALIGRTGKLTNKGPVGAPQFTHSLSGPGNGGLSLADREALLKAPAFDENGEPIS